MVNITKEILAWKDISKLKELLKNLKLYRDLTKKLWNRWKKLFDNLINKKDFYKVQYFSSLKQEDVEQEAIKAFKKIFSVDVNKENIVFEKNKWIDWWIRIFKNDDLVDLSFKKIENILK